MWSLRLDFFLIKMPLGSIGSLFFLGILIRLMIYSRITPMDFKQLIFFSNGELTKESMELTRYRDIFVTVVVIFGELLQFAI